jgi:hypothetical protein
MANPQPVSPVKLIVAILWSSTDQLELARAPLIQAFGPIDYEGPDHLFDTTNFYNAEMGTPIHRRILSHQYLVPPESLVEAKERTNDIEDLLRHNGPRRVNLDVGYLDLHKVVLASMKPAGQKLHLARGVYADLTLRFARGNYQPLEWTFLDLRDGRYQSDFNNIRAILRDTLRNKGTHD